MNYIWLICIAVVGCASNVDVPPEQTPPVEEQTPWLDGPCETDADCEYACFRVLGPDADKRFCLDNVPSKDNDLEYACLGASVCVTPCSEDTSCTKIVGAPEPYVAIPCDKGCPEGMRCADVEGVCMWPNEVMP